MAVTRSKLSALDRVHFVDLPLVRSCQLFTVFCEKGQVLVNLLLKTILYGGSLGSGVDEERSKLRVGM